MKVEHVAFLVDDPNAVAPGDTVWMRGGVLTQRRRLVRGIGFENGLASRPMRSCTVSWDA